MKTKVDLAAEGDLDEAVLRRLIERKARRLTAEDCLGKRGRDDLLAQIPGFRAAAAYRPMIILADLDDDLCAPALLQTSLPHGAHANLMFRVAVREIESWLLANRFGFADFLGVPVARIPEQAELERHPKDLVVRLARRSNKKLIRDELAPRPNSTSRIGPNYVGRLADFVASSWDVDDAATRSDSLQRAIAALARYQPIVP